MDMSSSLLVEPTCGTYVAGFFCCEHEQMNKMNRNSFHWCLLWLLLHHDMVPDLIQAS